MPRMHPYLDVPRPLAFAHRGGASPHPENTEAAFRHALELGFTHLESDVHVTRDGVAIAFHDERLDRVTDRSGAVAELDWREVRRARVGGTEPILRLDELFEAFPEARLNLDPKSDAAVPALADAIESAGALARVMVGSFSDARLAALRERLGPGLAWSAGPRSMVRFLARARHLPMRLPDCDALQVPVRSGPLSIVTRRLLDVAHAHGVQVHVWTVDDEQEMHRLLDLGVDGIMTDRPEVLRDVLIARGVWHGPSPTDR